MPTELEELVEFLHHGNNQIRQIAVENLVPYSKAQPSIFKSNQLAPVRDLKLLVKDYAPIAKHVLDILINLLTDREILKFLAEDDALLESILLRVTNPKEPNADLLCMLLANLSKSDSMARLLTLTRKPVPPLSTSSTALTQLLDLYSKGAEARYNPHASFDYLAYLFAELSKFPSTAIFLTSPSPPLAQHLTPFTAPSASYERRLGTASTIRNTLLALPSPTTSIPTFLPSILPSLLSPLIGPDPPFSEQETELLPPELQYLGADQKREEDVGILGLLLDALFLCAVRGGEEGRKAVKGMGAYAVVRECHAGVEDEEVQEKAERVVQVLMREEAEAEAEAPPEGDPKAKKGAVIGEVEPEDEEGVVDVF